MKKLATRIRDRSRLRLTAQIAWRNDHASQMVEFAVSLPLLVVFVVGIFDFSGAFTLKQKLTNAARDAARAAAADPATDLGNPSGTPSSVLDAFEVVDNYLAANKLSDCGIIQTALGPGTGNAALTWSATAATCPPSAGMSQISINRGFIATQTVGTTQMKLVMTKITIQYAYTWRFNRVISVLVSSATYASITTLSASATALNEN